MTSKQFLLLVFIMLLVTVIFMDRFFIIEIGEDPASTEPESAECFVQGEVLNYETRQETFTVQEQKSITTKIPEFKTYHDLTLKVIDQSYLNKEDAEKPLFQAHTYNCDLKNIEYTFQLSEEDKLKLLENVPSESQLTGMCLQGTGQFLHKEFLSGTWLYDIKILPYEICKTAL